MDSFDSKRYATAYRALADICARDRSEEQEAHHLSFVLGDLTRRIFVGTRYLPPDELLEEAAQVLRGGDRAAHAEMAKRLQDHAQHLEDLDHPTG